MKKFAFISAIALLIAPAFFLIGPKASFFSHEQKFLYEITHSYAPIMIAIGAMIYFLEACVWPALVKDTDRARSVRTANE